MKNGSFAFYIEPLMINKGEVYGVFVEIYYDNKFHSIDTEICELFNITLESYHKRLESVFKNCFKNSDQIYYDKLEGDKINCIKADKLFNDKYFNDLKDKFKEAFCKELILLNL